MAKKNFMGAFGDVVEQPQQNMSQEEQAQPKTQTKTPKQEEGKVQINAVIDADLKAKLGVIAARQGIKKKELLNAIIAEYINNHYND